MQASDTQKRAGGVFKWLNMPFVDKALEREFIDFYVMGTLRVSQTLMSIGLFAFYISFVSDQVMDPSGSNQHHIARGIVASPIMLGCIVILFIRPMQKYYEKIAFIYYLSAQIVLCHIYTSIDKGFQYGSMSFILLLMGSNLTFSIRLKYTILMSTFSLISITACELYARNSAPGWLLINSYYLTTAIVFSSISAHMKERTARRRFLIERAIVESQQRVDGLIHSMLPRQIALRMQAGETSIADSLGEVTILFATVGDLHAPQRRADPLELVKGLNRLFSLFDIEADRFGIEKIKTIGGSYMALGGLTPGATAGDHAENTARFALAIRDVVSGWNALLGIHIEFRIGIHVGPIVAGVIGRQRPRFDCWGDSANIASRLEASGQSGDITISESTYWRLKQSFAIAPIGDIELKGVGLVSAYQLEGHLG